MSKSHRLSEPELHAYLTRIGLAAKPAPTLAGLAALQRAHMQTVPFENLDVFLRRALDLSPEALYAKIVERRRGGYCFELNQLYATLLRSVGFADVRRVMARVWLRHPDPQTRTHLAHLVTLGGRRYLTDVGFGGYTAREPVDIDNADGIDDGEGLIRVRPDETWGHMLERRLDGRWMPQYSFDLAAVADQDITAANYWMETHPVSHFREQRFVALFTPQGRVGLWDDELRDRTGTADPTVESIALDEAWPAEVERRFGVDLGELTAWERSRLLG